MPIINQFFNRYPTSLLNNFHSTIHQPAKYQAWKVPLFSHNISILKMVAKKITPHDNIKLRQRIEYHTYDLKRTCVYEIIIRLFENPFCGVYRQHINIQRPSYETLKGSWRTVRVTLYWPGVTNRGDVITFACLFVDTCSAPGMARIGEIRSLPNVRTQKPTHRLSS